MLQLHYAVWGRCFPDFAFPSQRKVDMYRVVVLLQNLSQLLFPVSLIEKAETSIKCWKLCISLNTCTGYNVAECIKANLYRVV